MKKYDGDDEMTMYFIIRRKKELKQKLGDGVIAGYTDNRSLAEAYIEFHNCSAFKIKAMTGKFDNICKILEENPFDEIEICNISTRDPDNRHNAIYLSIPMTRSEQTLVNSERISLMSSRVNYRVLDSSMEFLKDKYQKALSILHLKDAIRQAQQESQKSNFISSIDIDDLVVFFRSCPDDFG